MSRFEDYSSRYKAVRFKRENGILELAIHRDGGPAQWAANPGGIHDELGDAFHQVGRDPENRIVITTGMGDELLGNRA
jgi:enoyl-CoA hydratase/carnithine racemase